MNNGSDIEVRVTANLGELERGMEQAAQSVENGAQRMDSSLKTAGDSMSGVAELVRSRLAMVAGIAAAAFASIGLKSAAEDAAKFTESSMDLGRAMGVSASQASVWSAVLDDVGASQEELAAASRGLTTKLRDSEEGLNRMGLVTRDSNGKLRNMNDLMHDAIAVVNSYREGTDRNAAAQEVFGRAVSGSSKLLMVTRDAARETEEKMRSLGIVVGQEDVEAWRAYDQASDDADLTMKAVRDTIGRALIPVLTAFKEKIVAIGPELVKIARVAMETFLGVVDLARMVKQAFVSVGSDIGAVAAAAALALRGDFTGAMNVFRERTADAVRETQKLKDLWNGTGDSFLGKFRQKWEASATPDQGGSDYEAPPSSGGGSRKGSSTKADGPIDALGSGSFITSDKGVAEMIREQQEAINALNGEIAAGVEAAAKTAAEAYKRAMDQRQQVDLIWMRNAVDARLAVVDADEAAAHHAVEMGVMTHEELLQQQIGFEQRRNEIILQAMNERLAMIDPSEDPVAFAQLKAEIEAAERQHQAIMTEIKNAGELERNQYALQAIGSLQGSMQNAFQKMLMGQMSLAQGLKSIWQSVLSTIAGVIAQVLAKWIASKIAMLIVGKKTALSEISESAAKAGAGGVASMAAAPYPINLTAPFFGAAMSAASMGFASMMAPTASAAGGYDIPAGVNPLTQLHAREMVLPAKQADVIRDMADGGARGGDIHVHITSHDTQGVRDLFMNNQPVLIEAIRNAYRNGHK